MAAKPPPPNATPLNPTCGMEPGQGLEASAENRAPQPPFPQQYKLRNSSRTLQQSQPALNNYWMVSTSMRDPS